MAKGQDCDTSNTREFVLHSRYSLSCSWVGASISPLSPESQSDRSQAVTVMASFGASDFNSKF